MKKRVLFIDRDGTLILESPGDFQVDSLEKLVFYPGIFRNMYQIKKNLNFELVIVTNQDGLGTPAFPEDTFWPVHNKMIKSFENEGITFDDILIDKSFPEDNLPTRKPGIKMLANYLTDEYDLTNSYVIGDRITDIELARNLGAKGILIGEQDQWKILDELNLSSHCVLVTENWDNIYQLLITGDRKVVVERNTAETKVYIALDLDGSGKSEIQTGLGFFNHMLDQIAKHSGIDLIIDVQGDLNVDEHHTIEDTGIALGEAILKALGNKRGIERYGFVLPMDDCLAQVALDFGGRSWFVWETEFLREKIGDVPCEMFFHFFKSLSDSAKMNLNIKAEGKNEHHKIESIFKAFARAIKNAIRKDIFSNSLPSTKGVL